MKEKNWIIMVCKNCGSEIPDDARSCPHCGEALSKEEEISIKALNIEDNLDGLESEFLEIVGKDFVFKDIEEKPEKKKNQIKKSIAFKLRSNSSNPDFKLYLDGETETVFLLQYLPSRFYFVVEKLSSAPISDVKVQLSGPPQIKLLVKSRKVNATKMKNRFHFTISASEPGFFILTATLTSKVGHRIAFPIEVQVEPKYPNSVKSTYGRDLASKTSSSNGGSIAAIIIVGVIGVILLLTGFLMVGSGMFALGISLIIIGSIITTIEIGIATKGQCCLACGSSC